MAPIFTSRLWRCGLLGMNPLADTYENQCEPTQCIAGTFAGLLVRVGQISVEDEIAWSALRAVHQDMMRSPQAFSEAPTFFHTPQEVEPA